MRAIRLLAAAGTLVLAACACSNGSSDSAQGSAGGGSRATSSKTATATDACFDEGKPFDGDSRVYIEHNATDKDTGFHAMWGAEGLSKVCIAAPDGTPVLIMDPTHQLDGLGLNDVFFESREPPNAEYSVADLKTDFPEGRYTLSGIDYQGTRQVAHALFTHDIPGQPTITSPKLVAEGKAASNTVPATGLTVRWKPVTKTLDGKPVDMTAYQVTVTEVEHTDPHSQSQPVYDVHVPPDTTELAVPHGFLKPKTLYEAEVLAIEKSGNQTITVGFFTTR